MNKEALAHWGGGAIAPKRKEEIGNTLGKKVCKSGEMTCLGDLAVDGDYIKVQLRERVLRADRFKVARNRSHLPPSCEQCNKSYFT